MLMGVSGIFDPCFMVGGAWRASTSVMHDGSPATKSGKCKIMRPKRPLPRYKKKKELLGQYKNADKEWHPEGQPEQVKVHDFIDPELGRANPYGVYDLGSNSAWVSVGTDHDTSSFAVATIRRWWQSMGQALYPSAKELTITADGAGSNGEGARRD